MLRAGIGRLYWLFRAASPTLTGSRREKRRGAGYHDSNDADEIFAQFGAKNEKDVGDLRGWDHRTARVLGALAPIERHDIFICANRTPCIDGECAAAK